MKAYWQRLPDQPSYKKVEPALIKEYGQEISLNSKVLDKMVRNLKNRSGGKPNLSKLPPVPHKFEEEKFKTPRNETAHSSVLVCDTTLDLPSVI